MAVVRKLLDAKNPPENACLILPRFLVNRLIGEPKQTGLSVLYGPFFQFTKICRLQPTDFRPIPSVDSDLIKISKRASPLISWKERSSYTHFIKAGFLHGDAVDRNLQKLYPKETIKAVFSKHGIGRDTLPNRLSLVLWLRLYQALGTQA
jgi:16S rRNA A1518/A1519 N6-dimethyltransferase RsmA/KsgA/DIM1 with predicted DNA glycosylase/AP lyase activity